MNRNLTKSDTDFSNKINLGNGLLLSHLQQLRQWQQHQQDNLRDVQRSQLAQIQSEQQKIKDILKNPIAGLKVDRAPIEKQQDIQNSELCSHKVVPEKNSQKTMEDDIPLQNQSVKQERSITSRKSPFCFLKKGAGLARFKGKGIQNEKLEKNKRAINMDKKPPTVLIQKLSMKRTDKNESKDVLPEKAPIAYQTSRNKLLMKTPSSRENEVDELVEFEILEQVTRNCSFNSDSSIMKNLVNKSNKPVNLAVERQYGCPTLNDISVKNVFTKEGINGDSDFSCTVETPNSTTSSEDCNLNSHRHSSSSEDTLCNADLSTDSDIEELVELKQFCADAIEEIDTEHPLNEKWKSLGSMEWSVSTPLNSSCLTEDEKIDSTVDAQALLEKKLEKSVIIAATGNERLLIQERLKDLEVEIQSFRKENQCLEKLKRHQQELVEMTKKERLEFKMKQDEERKKFEVYLTEGRKKLRKQQVVFENFQKARKHFPDKKEREEMADLKTEVQRLQDDLKKQKIHMTAEAGRLRSQINSIEKDRELLKGQVAKLEKEKLELLDIIQDFKERASSPKPARLRKPVVSKLKVPKALAKKASKIKSTDNQPQEKKGVVELKTLGPKVIQNKDEDCEPRINSEKEWKNSKRVQFDLKTDSEVKNLSLCLDSNENTEDEHERLHEDFQIISHFDKIEKIYLNGEREFVYNSGTRKIIDKDSSSTTVYFYNGDVLMTLPDKTEIYHFMDCGVKQTQFSDGTILIEFPNGQEERHKKDGSKEILLENGTVHVLNSDGSQEIKSQDGSILRIASDGSKLLEFKNGEKEIQTNDFKRREYNDGTVKIVHSDGKEETRYPNGRLRIKDKDHNVLVDSKYS